MPINVAFEANNVVVHVKKVDQIQNLMSKGNDGQSSVLSPVFNVVDYHVAFDKNTQPSRPKPSKRDKVAAAVQVHGNRASQL